MLFICKQNGTSISFFVLLLDHDLFCFSVSIFFHRSKKLIHTSSCICRKQCVQTFNVFDFLNDIVSKVPDLGGSVAIGDDQTVTKRRFVFNCSLLLFLGELFMLIVFCCVLGKLLKMMIMTATKKPREIKW